MRSSDPDPLPAGHGDPSRLAVDVALDGVRAALSRRRVAWLVRETLRAEEVHDALISVTFTGEHAMALLNEEHLGHEGPTDVISFALDRPVPGAPVVGDIYICPAVVRAQAADHGRPVREELTRVVIHGVLHVVGHDHPEDERRTGSPMWLRQERLVSGLLASPDE